MELYRTTCVFIRGRNPESQQASNCTTLVETRGREEHGNELWEDAASLDQKSDPSRGRDDLIFSIRGHEEKGEVSK